MRLIDADAMKTHIMEFACDPCKKYGADRDGIRCPFCNTGNLLGEIDDAPTVDAVEVVRCEDCIHGIPTCIDTVTGEFSDVRYCNRHHMCHFEDYYCADGKLKEDGADGQE